MSQKSVEMSVLVHYKMKISDKIISSFKLRPYSGIIVSDSSIKKQHHTSLYNHKKSSDKEENNICIKFYNNKNNL